MSWLTLLFFLPVFGICRHRAGDPACSSSSAGQARAAAATSRRADDKVEKAEKELRRVQKLLDAPDPKLYEIVEIEEVKGGSTQFLQTNLVVKAKYPHCKDCYYEGTKIIVFENCSYKDAVMWRSIDPHFGDPNLKGTGNSAPVPAARFPASDVGWKHAIEFAKRL
jgi:hypothetical protein